MIPLTVPFTVTPSRNYIGNWEDSKSDPNLLGFLLKTTISEQKTPSEWSFEKGRSVALVNPHLT